VQFAREGSRAYKQNGVSHQGWAMGDGWKAVVAKKRRGTSFFLLWEKSRGPRGMRIVWGMVQAKRIGKRVNPP